MNYYWFNRQEILQKVKERYSKEKAAEYYMQNREVLKEKSRNRYKNLSEDQQLIQYKKEALKNKFKQAIELDLVDASKILVSGRLRHSEEGFKYFIGYQEDEIVKPLCII